MKIFKTCVFVLILFVTTLMAGENHYSKVKIILNSTEQLQQLAAAGLIFDHVQVQKEASANFSYTAILDSRELRILDNCGIAYQVLITDVVEDYKQRRQKRSVPFSVLDAGDPLQGFQLGSLGGFYTFDEVVSELDSMYLLYPNIITEKKSIGSTHEGRSLWMVKISDNPNSDEDEPQVLYNAMHHAREPGSMMTLLYFMYYLLENYGSDPEVTYLVDNRELYFVPVVNPDGYEYNRQMAPGGGYLWRKNKRDNDLDTLFSEQFDGVDLNRNYGYEWGYDDLGSSSDIGAATYRGPKPFSEPETEAIAEFCSLRNFKIALNYHTFGNWLIYPWGYLASFETKDSTTYRELAKEMTRFNKYIYGTADQTVRYNVNGSSDDWMYGEQSLKDKIFSLTPEVGTGQDHFWPDPERIYPQVQENLFANLFVAWAAGGILRYTDYSVSYANNRAYLEAGSENEIVFLLRNLGLGTSDQASIRLTSEDSLVSVAKKSITISPLGSQDTVTSEALKFLINPAAPSGYIPRFNLEITQGGVTTVMPVAGLIVGKPITLFADDFEAANNQWEAETPWARTNEKAHGDLFSFSDSPQGNYGNSINTSLYLKRPFSIEKVNAAYLEFWTCWDIENDWDFAQVQVSHDSVNWISLQGFYTNPGSGIAVIQPSGSFGYDGVQKTWVKERINLTDYINSGPLYLRFNIQSDNFITGDGWYIDDLSLLVYRDSTLLSVKEVQLYSDRFTLHQNYPNPFNPVTQIRFELKKAAHVQIIIYNALGKKIRTLVNGRLGPGSYNTVWNGMNDDGESPASGIYFYVMQSENFRSQKKLLLLR